MAKKKLKICLDCGCDITRYSLRCQTCAAIERNKDLDYIKKQVCPTKDKKDLLKLKKR